MVRNLITGGMGFIGIHLARQLLAEDEEVVLFQRRSELPSSASDLKGKVEIISGDIGNWVSVVDAVKSSDVDCIYHSAALLGKACEDSPATGFRVNVIGTINVLEAARILGIKDIIYISSVATYGLHPPRNVYNDTPHKSENMYAATKICCEMLGEEYNRRYGVNFRALRLAMVVGPTRQISYNYGDWSGIIERTAQGRSYIAHSSPTIQCAYIYIKDAVQALIDLKRADENRLRQKVYNVHGFMATLTEVAGIVKKHIPDAQISFDWDKGEEMMAANSGINCEMDHTVAFEDFDYQPRYLLNEMVEDFIKEVRAGRAG